MQVYIPWPGSGSSFGSDWGYHQRNDNDDDNDDDDNDDDVGRYIFPGLALGAALGQTGVITNAMINRSAEVRKKLNMKYRILVHNN